MNWLHLICYVCVHQSISLCHANSRSGWCSLEDPPEGNLPGLGAQVREGMGPLLLLYIRALRHFSLSKLSIFFPKETETCVTDSSAGLQEHLLPATRTLPAAARALVNVNGLCHSRCSEEAQSMRCSLFYFLHGFRVGQSPFELFCPGC